MVKPNPDADLHCKVFVKIIPFNTTTNFALGYL